MTQGFIARADIATAGTPQLLTTITLNAGETAQTFNVRFCNRNATTVKVRLAVSAPGTTVGTITNADWLDFDTTVQPNGFLEDTGIRASAGEVVFIQSNATSVSVRMFGG